MTKASELIEMSGEQLTLTLKEASEDAVPHAAQVADRTARCSQRTAANNVV